MMNECKRPTNKKPHTPSEGQQRSMSTFHGSTVGSPQIIARLATPPHAARVRTVIANETAVFPRQERTKACGVGRDEINARD